MLIALQDDLAVEILFSWLQINELARLDLAYCRKADRSQWLSLLSSQSNVHSSCSLWNIAKARWIISRKIRVCEVFGISPTIEISVVNDLFAYCGNMINSVQCTGNLRGFPATTFKFVVNLRSVSIQNAVDDDIMHIVENCPQLQNLEMSCAVMLTDRTLQLVAEYCSNLQTILLYCSRSTLITDAGIECLASNCSKLCEIRLDAIHSLTDATLHAIGQYLPNIRSVCIESVMNMTNNGWIALAKHCAQLESVNISNANDDLLLALARGCPHLKIVKLNECSNITDIGIKAMSEHCFNLSWLDMFTFKNPPSAQYRLTEISLHGLKRFSIGGTRIATTKLLHSLAKFSPLLRHLTVCDHDDVDSDGVAALVGCAFLEEVYLCCSGNLNEGLVSLITCCQRLSAVKVVNNNRIDDLVVKRIFQMKSSALRTLNLFNCSKISETVMNALKLWRHNNDDAAVLSVL